VVCSTLFYTILSHRFLALTFVWHDAEDEIQKMVEPINEIRDSVGKWRATSNSFFQRSIALKTQVDELLQKVAISDQQMAQMQLQVLLLLSLSQLGNQR
jgi:hypothetical protein